MEQVLKDVTEVPLRDYVLAQSALVAARAAGAPPALPDLRARVESVMRAASEGRTPWAEGQVLYALESAAFGAPRSGEAKRYEAGAQANTGRADGVAGLGFGAALLALLAGAASALAGSRIGARVRRIKAMLSPAGAPDALAGKSPALPAALPPLNYEGFSGYAGRHESAASLAVMDSGPVTGDGLWGGGCVRAASPDGGAGCEGGGE